MTDTLKTEDLLNKINDSVKSIMTNFTFKELMSLHN